MWDIGTTIGTPKGTGTLTAFEGNEAIFTFEDGSTYRHPYNKATQAQAERAKSTHRRYGKKAVKKEQAPLQTEVDLQAELAKAQAKVEAARARAKALAV